MVLCAVDLGAERTELTPRQGYPSRHPGEVVRGAYSVALRTRPPLRTLTGPRQGGDRVQQSSLPTAEICEFSSGPSWPGD